MRRYNLPSHLPPAILDMEPIPQRFFMTSERVTVFDDRDHARMVPIRSYLPRGPLEGQVSLYE